MTSPLGRKPRLAVVGFQLHGLDEQLVSALEEVVSAEAALVSEMEIVSASDLKAFLNVAQYQRLLGCSEPICLTEFGSLLATQRMISGSISKVGERHLVALRLYDLVNGRVLQRSSQETEASLDILPEAVRRAVPGLFGVVGKIQVWNQPFGGEVFLDGRLVGPTPVERIAVRVPGKHTVSISGPGITGWQQEVLVEPGADLRLRAGNLQMVELEQRASSRRTWGWSLGGVAVASVLSAGLLYYLAWDNDQQLGNRDLRTVEQAEIDDINGTTRRLAIGSVALAALAAGLGATSVSLLLSNPAQETLDDHLESH